MPPDCWIIMGDYDVGKSTTTRALTGVWNSNHKDIETFAGRLNRVWVQVRSLQEINMHYISFLLRHYYDNYALVNLRINASRQKPDGLFYLNLFHSQNWNIREIVVLGRNMLSFNLPGHFPQPSFVSNSTQIPANLIAHQIRQLWNWF